MKPHVFISGRGDTSSKRIESDEVDLALSGFVVTHDRNEAHAVYCASADSDQTVLFAQTCGIPVYYSVRALIESFTWPFPPAQMDHEMKPRVYIASPYTRDPEGGVRRQIDAAHELIDSGFAPFWPLASHYVHLAHPKDYHVWADLDLNFLPICHAILRLDGESPGADEEVNTARRLGIPVYYSVKALVESFTWPFPASTN